jgi:DNA-binding NarL/FixJ family response regulator
MEPRVLIDKSSIGRDISLLPELGMTMIRVALMVDNRLVREGLISLIGDQPDIEIVGAFTGWEAVLWRVGELAPTVLLLDLGLKSHNSLRAAEVINRRFPAVKVIVMDLALMQPELVHFVRAGVSGFIHKDATLDDFLKTIRSVAGGTKVLPPSLIGSLFSQITELALKRSDPELLQAVQMTKRERQIIELISDGLSNKEIAQRINVATFTVKSHVHSILEKLGLQSRLQVAACFHSQDTNRASRRIEPGDREECREPGG